MCRESCGSRRWKSCQNQSCRRKHRRSHKKQKAAFGGEPCGAWIHLDLHYCPDGILSSVLLLQALEDTDQSLSRVISEIPKYPSLRQNVDCPNSIKPTVLETICEALPTVYSQVREQSKIDGFRLVLKQGWLLVRASGTEPLIRITVEAENKKAVETIMKKAFKLARKIVKETRQ